MATDSQVLNYLFASYIGLKTNRMAVEVLKEARMYYDGAEGEKEPRRKGFSWRQALRDNNVPEEDIDDFLRIRKEKHHTDTHKSWNEMCKEVDSLSLDMATAISIAVSKGWGYFRADWIRKDDIPKQQSIFQ